MCKHASAVLYGVGARLDAEPDFLFALRGVDRSELIAGAGRNPPIGQTQVAAERIVAEDDVAALFGLELEPAPSRSGSKDADTSLKSGISGRTQRATPFNRPPAKEPISLNSNSTRTKPTPTRSKDAKASPVSSLSRPTPTRTALKPESREGRRNQQLRQFGHPEKRQSRTLGQANRLRRHWNRNPVVAVKRLWRNGRSGKSRRPAILEYGPSPRFPKNRHESLRCDEALNCMSSTMLRQ